MFPPSFFIACLLFSFGSPPNDLILPMSSSMFLTSSFHPLPPFTPPVRVSFTFLSFVSSMIICAMVLTLIWSSEPTL